MGIGEQTTTTRGHVAVVGGGVTGLSAAWYLQKQGIDYTLLEKDSVWGGKVRTVHVDHEDVGHFVIETAADSFLTQKPWALHLAQELGMEDRLLGTNDDQRKVYVLNNNRLTPLPDGVLLIVPTRFMPFALSPLISPVGKLRMAMELFIPPKRDGADESLADFVRRRLGEEALEKLAEPLMAGIYNTEAEQQSLLATFPRFRNLEEKYGSITRGMIDSMRNRKAPPPGAKKRSTFTSFLGGMQEFVDELSSQLSGDLRLNTGVREITQAPDGTYDLLLEDGDNVQADAVVLTAPAGPASKLLVNLAPQAAKRVGEVRYVSTGTVSLGYRTADIGEPLDGFGVVIPRNAGRGINAITWSSTKFDHRAPEGYELVRVFFGGSRSPQSMDLSDDDLMAMVRRELANILGLNAEPVFHQIFRWHNANPQYDVGHNERMDAVEADLPAGLYLAGSAYRGIGVPDCVRQGKEAAECVGETLRANA